MATSSSCLHDKSQYEDFFLDPIPGGYGLEKVSFLFHFPCTDFISVELGLQSHSFLFFILPFGYQRQSAKFGILNKNSKPTKGKKVGYNLDLTSAKMRKKQLKWDTLTSTNS